VAAMSFLRRYALVLAIFYVLALAAVVVFG
jgi:hypothetical protein